MALRVFYEASGTATDPFEDITDRVRLYTLDATIKAEEGSVALSTIPVDDPDGDYDIVGWRRISAYEDTATGSNTLVGVWWVADRKVTRGPYLTGSGRLWTVSLADMNSVLSHRVLHNPDANRSAETDTARLNWLLGTLGTPGIPTTEYVNSSGGVSMDAVDYRGQTRIDVINDCAQQSGKNFFVYVKDGGSHLSPAWGLGLWYDHAYSTAYSSIVRLTNVAAEVDGVTTFAIGDDTELIRDPSRVYSGAYVRYDGGTVYQESIATSNAFTRRDAIVPADNVKSSAKATARANRYLLDMNSEEDRITTSFYAPASRLNLVREGMRVQLKATHLPGYGTTYSWLRVLRRSITQVAEEQPTDSQYLVTLELASNGPAFTCDGGAYDLTPSQTFDTLGNNPSPSPGYVYYGAGSPASSPQIGVGPDWGFPDYTGPGAPDYAGDCTNSVLNFVLVGPGILSVQTAQHPGEPSSRGMTYTVYHWSGGIETVDAEGTLTPGDLVNLSIPADESENCVHTVSFGDGDGTCGGKWGWSGATWTATGGV